MTKEYKTYAMAVRNRKRDEVTVYDRKMKVYRNVRIKRKKRGTFLW